MTTRIQKFHEEKGKHTVGNLNSLKVKTVANGAKALEDADNFTLVELAFDAEGERVFKPLAAVANKGYLLAAPETRYFGEALTDFYVGEGERARIVVLEEGYTRFESSAFDAAGVQGIVNGQVAYFKPADKKFVILPANTEDADYVAAKNKFLVVSNEDDLDYSLGAETVRFEVLEA